MKTTLDNLLEKIKTKPNPPVWARCSCCSYSVLRNTLNNTEFILGRGCTRGPTIPNRHDPIRKHLWEIRT